MNNEPAPALPVETAAALSNNGNDVIAEPHTTQVHESASSVAVSPTLTLSTLFRNFPPRVPESERPLVPATLNDRLSANRQSRNYNRSLEAFYEIPGLPTLGSAHAEAEARNPPVHHESSTGFRTRLILPDDLEARQRVLDNGVRQVQENMATAELARATMRPEVPQFSPALPNESIENYLARRHREQTLGYLERQEEFRQRVREMEQFQTDHPELSNTMTAALNATVAAASVTTETEDTESAAIIENSATTRRDLEQAYRDYRVARRALRTRNADVLNAAREQANDPTYSGVVARIAEHSSNNRDRMRARGHSRSNTLDRSDALVDRLATASGISTDVWGGDDDRDAIVGASAATGRLIGIGETVSGQGPRSSLPNGVTATSGPHLASTTTARDTGIPLVSTRDTLRRIEGRERHSIVLSNAIRPLADSRNASVDLTSRPGSSRLELSAEDAQRFTETVQRFNSTLAHHVPHPNVRSSAGPKPVRPSHNAAKKRAKGALKYLSELKNLDNDGERSLALASSLGIDSLASSLAQETEVDLPLRVRELPRPPYSSWLESGMAWEGVQKGGFGKPEAGLGHASTTGPLFQRDLQDQEAVRQLRRASNRLLAAATNDQERDETIVRYEIEARALLRNRNNSFADMETRLTHLLEEGHGRDADDDWELVGAGARSMARNPRRVVAPVTVEKEETGDKWPVSVRLHQVNWDEMSLTGTMVANQIPDRARLTLPPNDASTQGDEGKDKDTGTIGMETFFDGDIIDFHTHDLETSADKAGYKVGGLITDIKYWSRIGPFKQEVEKNLDIARTKKASEAYEKFGLKGTVDEKKAEYKRTFQTEKGNADELDKEEIGTVIYDTMADCLSSRKWLEKAQGEGGWVFMRWKERCFITPESTRPSSSSSATNVPEHHIRYQTRTIVHRPTATTQSYTTINDQHNDRASWGLTIRGFYYVAMHRSSGKIEALYYDSGSQPYQELTCKPVGMGSGSNNGIQDDDDVFGIVGVKRHFGTFEFR